MKSNGVALSGEGNPPSESSEVGETRQIMVLSLGALTYMHHTVAQDGSNHLIPGNVVKIHHTLKCSSSQSPTT